jgi:hypothetical protein
VGPSPARVPPTMEWSAVGGPHLLRPRRFVTMGSVTRRILRSIKGEVSGPITVGLYEGPSFHSLKEKKNSFNHFQNSCTPTNKEEMKSRYIVSNRKPVFHSIIIKFMKRGKIKPCRN